MMTVRRLRLVDFRSHASREIVAGNGFVAISGENGAGKTNLLEAVSLLAPGRGLRGAALPEMARTGGAGGFAVAALLADGNEIGTGTQPAMPERRQVRVNGAPVAATALAERLSISWLVPAMDRLFVEGAGGRRRFLDRLTLAFEPDHARHATRYEAAMRDRNALLADAGADPSWLGGLEAAMAEHGAAIAAARDRTVALLAARLEAAPDGAFPRAGLALAGWTDGDLAAELVSGRGRDAAAGRTLAGPHRSDLAVTHLDKAAPASRASTGEQKAMLLGIVLAHAAAVAEGSGRPPVLLLDEVAAHLDPARREALFARLAALGGQVWMTGTEPGLFEALPGDATRIVLPA